MQIIYLSRLISLPPPSHVPYRRASHVVTVTVSRSPAHPPRTTPPHTASPPYAHHRTRMWRWRTTRRAAADDEAGARADGDVDPQPPGGPRRGRARAGRCRRVLAGGVATPDSVYVGTSVCPRACAAARACARPTTRPMLALSNLVSLCCRCHPSANAPRCRRARGAASPYTRVRVLSHTTMIWLCKRTTGHADDRGVRTERSPHRPS
ncbi:hypothetical protein DFH08DRAFT_866027 [Mycena albidolilacea]|uniref:Uncharacterized protein n=1 Tax=Mycena albidolilacea TaxID=1033008 RepID=A0AAD7ET41_9AGAR|nr:hypothetical protein DFH08DRAFT_866027 [Mycena albidolilacea]